MLFILYLFIDFVLSVERSKVIPPDPETLGPYFCGGDSVSAWSSYFMTLSCDQNSINSCCAIHDQCYSTCALPQSECDDQFCNCLRSLPGSSYCRQLVHSTHCSLVQFLGHNYICPDKAQPPFNPLKSLEAEHPLPPPLARPFQGPPPIQFYGKSEYMPSPLDQLQPHHMLNFQGDMGDPYELLFSMASSLNKFLCLYIVIGFWIL
ncbi:unnamed protein product, partial [Mesorhabditis belari]|uniref:Phospholipase A2 n=1 Tax=Mesorhabditis belari TaxID=2138241 RepID=A0AAF3EVL6_9BILA